MPTDPSTPSKSRIQQYLDMMVYIIVADGKVQPQEREQFLSLMKGMQLDCKLIDHYRSMLEKEPFPRVSDRQLREVVQDLDPDSLAHLMIDAYRVAFSDGKLQEEETEVIRRCLTAAGISPDRFGPIESWARHTLELARMGRELFLPQPEKPPVE
jgi:uncharacterized tellurite resistance protein B-like protein